MKTLFWECGMGAAGDMLAAALLELCPDREALVAAVNAAGIPGVAVSAEPSVKCGITGTHFKVLVRGEEERSEDVHTLTHEHAHEHAHHHGHASFGDICGLIGALRVSDKVKKDAVAVYRLIAEAESAVHGRPVTEVHFHEVGAMDAVADIVTVSLLMERLAPEKVLASPVHVGSGKVRCAHGVLPVPAPATALILRGVPVYGGSIEGELCTPTGAALLKHFVSAYGPMPVMRADGIGYGMGTKDFEAANCLRAFLGETESAQSGVTELCCNLDDMTPEAVGFVQELLFEHGALDVWTVPIGMKKGRPGVQLWCMCDPGDAGKLRTLIFRHTTTWGLRVYEPKRFTLSRAIETVETAYGPVRLKSAVVDGAGKTKAEYEDLARIAREQGVSLAEAAALWRKD